MLCLLPLPRGLASIGARGLASAGARGLACIGCPEGLAASAPPEETFGLVGVAPEMPPSLSPGTGGSVGRALELDDRFPASPLLLSRRGGTASAFSAGASGGDVPN